MEKDYRHFIGRPLSNARLATNLIQTRNLGSDKILEMLTTIRENL